MEFNHAPVLPDECIEYLEVDPEGTYIDGTIGGGGHSELICRRLSEKGTLVGIDRDADALAAASHKLEKYGCRKHYVKSNYRHIKDVLKELGIATVNGALLDLGVSSFQLDEPERGFSYMQDSPLDMRMDQASGLTAEDVVNTYSERELAGIIRAYGEERWASRIAQFIVKARKEERIRTSGRLVDIIKAAVPASARREGPHPAKRTFQALRIEVNDELGGLESAVSEFMDILAPGGRLAIISFHSLEDRIVKEAFAKRADPCTCPPEFPVCVCGKVADIKKITKKPITASKEELDGNPRSRSAKLRVVEKRG